jgi:hypothetical protein
MSGNLERRLSSLRCLMLATGAGALLLVAGAAYASAYGIQYWGAFTVNIGGQSIGIPSGQLAHRINGSGTRITSEWAHITTHPGLFSDNHLGRLATTILAGGEDRREGVARAEV